MNMTTPEFHLREKQADGKYLILVSNHKTRMVYGAARLFLEEGTIDRIQKYLDSIELLSGQNEKGLQDTAKWSGR